MTWQTNPLTIRMRNVARKLGLGRRIAVLRRRSRYEEAFDHALFMTLGAGDVVWDVGANVGYYTKRFVEAVGPTGYVVAFEPLPATAQELRAGMQGIPNYSLQMLALGAEDGETIMQGGDDPLRATSRINTNAEDGIPIKLMKGDTVLDRVDVPSPTVLKIDTEGYELEVLQGMPHLLSMPQVRAVFIEVHFGLLASRGQPHAPAEIERLLKAAGFATHWVDSSHICAQRV